MTLPPLRDRTFSDDEPVKVSICTCSYQNENHLRQSIEGFLDQQAGFRIEVIIYDDCSTDGSREILADYAEHYPTIFRLILADRNYYKLGVSPYLAFVMPEARGEYIAFCDADDFWRDPHKLAIQAACLDAEPDVSLTYGTALLVHGDRETGKTVPIEDRDLSAFELKTGANVNTMTACFRNPRFVLPEGFLRHAKFQDVAMWALLGGMGRGKFLSELAPAFYRVHDDGVFSMQRVSYQLHMRLMSYACVAGYLDQVGDHAAERRILWRMLTTIVSRLGRLGTLRELASDRLSRLSRRPDAASDRRRPIEGHAAVNSGA